MNSKELIQSYLMSLDIYQHILSLICTDPEKQNLFFSNRSQFLDAFEIEPKYKLALMALSQEQIRFFAQSLINKRWGIVSQILELDTSTQHNYFRGFSAYCQKHPLHSSARKYELDAFLFCYYLNSNKSSTPTLKKKQKQLLSILNKDHSTHPIIQKPGLKPRTLIGLLKQRRRK